MGKKRKLHLWLFLFAQQSKKAFSCICVCHVSRSNVIVCDLTKKFFLCHLGKSCQFLLKWKYLCILWSHLNVSSIIFPKIRFMLVTSVKLIKAHFNNNFKKLFLTKTIILLIISIFFTIYVVLCKSYFCTNKIIGNSNEIKRRL